MRAGRRDFELVGDDFPAVFSVETGGGDAGVGPEDLDAGGAGDAMDFGQQEVADPPPLPG